MGEGELFYQLNDLDMLGVVETWMGEGEEIELEEHIYEGKVRKKIGGRGRHPGGVGVFMKKTIMKKIKVEKTRMDELMWVMYSYGGRNEILAIGIIYNHPVGSKYYNERFYVELDEEINRIKTKFKEAQICLMGDFNARVGRKEPYVNTRLHKNEYEREKEEVFTRESKDNKLNYEGRKMLELCGNNNLVILNGLAEGDEKGEYTFVNKVGNSVIDYVCVDVNMFNMVKKMKIEELG